MNGGNIFQGAPEDPDQEQFSTLLEDDRLRIVRIVSRGQSSPATGWYDQSENEWVMVLKGGAILSFDDGRSVTMAAGDFLHIPRHSRHRVDWTDPDKETIWLAVHYR
ncbi:MAG: cupin domain-containing protein [Gammaproteobacteria bacterium]|nr:cupin domain-containing protein [Gammaproteobacteria bacterium]